MTQEELTIYQEAALELAEARKLLKLKPGESVADACRRLKDQVSQLEDRIHDLYLELDA